MKKTFICYTMVLLLFISACSTSFEPSTAIKTINDSNTYNISFEAYMVDKNKEIVVTIMKEEKPIIQAYYQLYDKQNNFILFYNNNDEIPVTKYYAVEPQRIDERERNTYIEYLKELDQEYSNALKDLNLSEDKLFQIIEYFYNQK